MGSVKYPLIDALGFRLPVDVERTLVQDEHGNMKYEDRYIWVEEEGKDANRE